MVVTRPTDEGCAWSLENLTEICHRQPTCLVQVEPNPFNAVVGTMMSLCHGGELVVLWPKARGFMEARRLITQGERWRASWDSPDEGGYYYLPAP